MQISKKLIKKNLNEKLPKRLTDLIDELRAWLFTILRNNCCSHFQKHGRKVEDVDVAHVARLAVKSTRDGMLMSDEVLAASDFTYEEAVEIYGVSLGTIKSRMNRGRTALSALLGFGDDPAFNTTDRQLIEILSNCNDAA